MQFPMGPACIFLRKGIAEKQRSSGKHFLNLTRTKMGSSLTRIWAIS
uniref:Calcium binding protein 5 n=1 Tax=Mus musculus TaxID=10090 RepID=Q812F5_MOUSE|nr:calcium-binding protein type5 spliced variant [Mus musculus]